MERLLRCLGRGRVGATVTSSAGNPLIEGRLRHANLDKCFRRVISNSVIRGDGPRPSVCLGTYRTINILPRGTVKVRSSFGKVHTITTTKVATIVIPSVMRPSRRVHRVCSCYIRSLLRIGRLVRLGKV